jgi:hypothetical protein
MTGRDKIYFFTWISLAVTFRPDLAHRFYFSPSCTVAPPLLEPGYTKFLD